MIASDDTLQVELYLPDCGMDFGELVVVVRESNERYSYPGTLRRRSPQDLLTAAYLLLRRDGHLPDPTTACFACNHCGWRGPESEINTVRTFAGSRGEPPEDTDYCPDCGCDDIGRQANEDAL